MSTTPNLNQVHFRVRTDTADANTGTPTWAAAQDTGASIAVETTFRIRFTVQNTGTAVGSGPMIIRVSKNAGAYTAVTTSTGATLGAQSVDASSSADEALIALANHRLTAGAGTAANGLYDESGSAFAAVTNGQYAEEEYGLILSSAGAAPGDTFDFRLYNSTTAFTTYGQTPRITVPPADNTQDHFRVRTDTNAVTGTPTWAAAQDTNVSLAVETTFRIRFGVSNIGSVTGAATHALRVSKNSGAYTLVTIATGATLGAQSADASTSSADEASIPTANFLLTAGTGTALAGRYDETGTGNFSLPGGFYTEFEFGLILKTAGATTGDTFDFRIYNATLPYVAYTNTARVTVPGGTSNHACLANDVNSNSSVQTGANLQQVHGILANDVASPSSVSQPVLGIRRDCLANDVVSASSVSVPAATQIVPPVAALANDVLSASSVTNPGVQQRQVLLANDILSASSVQTGANLKQVHGTLANDVISTSSVGQPAVKSLHGLLANDVKSNSSVLQPSMGSVGNILANDVKSNSSVSQPAAAITRVCLANDVISASSVTQPAMVQRRDLLANDVKSNSSVGQPAAVIGRTLLANDVLSTSSVSQPAAVIQRAILANDVTSASFVTNPVVGIVGTLDARDIKSASSVGNPALHALHGLLANDVLSASSVTQPAALILRGLLANDVTSASSVSQPVAHQAQAFLANDVLSASSVTVPVAGEITAGQPLAEDVTAASFVSSPALAVVSGEVLPPVLGGAARPYGRYLTKKRWEDLLRQLEQERREARRRAERFKTKEDRAKARKAAVAASQAIVAAQEAADEAAIVAHVREITRLLEGAAQAKGLTEYLQQMEAAREAAIEMEMDDEDEAILLLVA